MTQIIIEIFTRFAKKLGRWVVKMLLKHGGAYILAHVERKIRLFKRRLKAAGITKRRRRWLKYRISNWSRFRDALTPKVLEHCDLCAEHVDRAVDSAIPLFNEWNNNRRRR